METKYMNLPVAEPMVPMVTWVDGTLVAPELVAAGPAVVPVT